METKISNIFIVDDNKLMLTALKQYLENRFGSNISITTFSDGESCLDKVNGETHIVILDYFLNGENGLNILKSIKDINPDTEVIMLSSNEDIAIAIDTFHAGAKDYVIKGKGAWKKIINIVEYIITTPVRLLVREFGVSKFMAIFLVTFVIMGIIVFWTLNHI